MRKKSVEPTKEIPVTFRMTQRDLNALDEIAGRMDRSRSWIIHKLCIDFVEKRSKGS